MNKQQARAIALDIAASLVESSTRNGDTLNMVFHENPGMSQADANKVLDEMVKIAHQLRDKLKYLPNPRVQAK